MRNVVVCLLVIVNVAAGGCWSSTPARAGRESDVVTGPVVPPEAWPVRDHSAVARLIAETPARVNVPPAQITIDNGKVPADSPAMADYDVLHVAPYGEGVVRVIQQMGITVKPAAKPGEWTVERTPTEEIIRFVSQSTLRNRPVNLAEVVAAGTYSARDAVYQDYLRMQDLPLPPNGRRVLREGLGGRLILPKGTARGLVVHLCGSASQPFEQPLVDELVRREWAVFMVPFVGVTGGSATRFGVGKSNEPRFSYVHTPPSLAATLDPMRGYETKVPLTKTLEVLDTPEALGQRLAAISDDRLAEVAYLIEAVLAYLQAKRPEVPTRPLVLMGCSAGSLVAPAVAARLPGRFAAAVLIGGGANLLRIGFESELEGVGPAVDWLPGQPVAAQKTAAIAAYERAARLDPARTGTALRAVPTLQVCAKGDRIVPAATGMELWHALGEPERWDYAGGHEFLFWRLHERAGDIAAWVEGAMKGRE